MWQPVNHGAGHVRYTTAGAYLYGSELYLKYIPDGVQGAFRPAAHVADCHDW